MAKYSGRLVKVGIGKESSRGAGVAPAVWVPFTSFSADDKAVQARAESGVGELIDVNESLVTTLHAEGDLEGEVRDESIGYILYNLLGTLNTTGSDPYTHAFSLNNTNSPNSLALVVADPNTTEMYRLCMVDSLEMSAELDELIKMTASFKAKTAVSSSATASYTAENKFSKKHLSVKVAANLAGLSAATALSLKSLTYTISKNVVADDVLGTVEPEDFLATQLMIEGEITLNYEDETWKNYMLNGTKRAMEIKLQNTDVDLGGSVNPSLTIQMPNVEFYDWEPNYALDEIVSQSLSFKALADLSGGNEAISTCTLVNGKASY